MCKPKPHGAVLAWLRGLSLDQGFFSVVTFGEIQKGVEMIRLRDPAKAYEIEVWALQLELASQVLPMDAPCFREYARLIPTARVHGLTIATRNERDFSSFSVRLLNPFRGP
jgi:toxin FitB